MTTAWIIVCFASAIWLLLLLRKDQLSLGLPFAFLSLLLLIHVPGAFAHAVGGGVLRGSEFVENGIGLTAFGSVCFVVGVWFSHLSVLKIASPPSIPITTIDRVTARYRFGIACLIGGWFFNYGLGFLRGIPSLDVVLDKGGAIWILGVIVGLQTSLSRGDVRWTGIWLAALMVYPLLMLVSGGFLGYGMATIIIVCCALAISARSKWKVAVSAAVAVYLGLSIFVNYFINRDRIRMVVWKGAPFEERVNVAVGAFLDFQLFDPSNRRHLIALDQRLNQNYFAGLAATRIERGQSDYLYGRSVWEALISLVPRALWPEKPVFGGSGNIVPEMTGLRLSTKSTSWGVGQVMEFQINFGIPGLIVGFVGLGWLLGTIDRKAAAAERRGDLASLIVFFLPGAALLQPNGSMVELTSGAAGALVIAFCWKWALMRWSGRVLSRSMSPLIGPRKLV